ncbi:glycoside hydrolase family 18 protein [Actinocorallia populi]|uniref:glycoside hydrolase family 18 protein n=1 Tax=Actinocorallia populi TaxID=2079200 RepID=UPI000D09480A|nr:glycoside hydrolase family 18 protein [Actinocorallia populi]
MSRTAYWTAAAVLSAVLVAVLPFAVGVIREETAAKDPGTSQREPAAKREYELIGYFPRWAAYQRDFRVKNLVTSGAADNLTTIQYAFAEPDPKGRCSVTAKGGSGASAHDDYVRSYKAEDSVDGVGDEAGDRLRGHFGQLQRLKRKYPDLKINLAIGGWTGSKYFSNGALTAASRKAMVESCLDLFIRGDLPEVEGAGGDGAAKGLFDGIDIDWEWPGSPGYNDNVHRPEDKRNLTLLLAEFRRQLDAQGRADGRRYGLTMFMPAAPGDVKHLEVEKIHRYLDYGSLQGYDLHGQWEERTNHQSNLYDVADDPGTPGRFSVDASLGAYLEAGWPASKMTLGIPMYGRGWKGVPGKNKGLWQAGTGPAEGAHEEGLEDYKVLVGREGTVHRDDEAGAVWKYDGETWWSYDDPELVTMKAAYIKKKKLRGGMFWSLDGDDDRASLSKALFKALS